MIRDKLSRNTKPTDDMIEYEERSTSTIVRWRKLA